jgi:hypothetical protein
MDGSKRPMANLSKPRCSIPGCGRPFRGAVNFEASHQTCEPSAPAGSSSKLQIHRRRKSKCWLINDSAKGRRGAW